MTSLLSYVRIDSRHWPVYRHYHSILAVFSYHTLYFDVKTLQYRSITNSFSRMYQCKFTRTRQARYV